MTEITGHALLSLAEGADMDLDTVRMLAANGSLEIAVQRYKRRKAAARERRMTGEQARAAFGGPRTLTPHQAKVELLRRRAA
ncbi:hypothetical protein AB0892_02715 [Streptomyces sp. NPDC005409]|uniref:hypothetical protein n=1 Tax=Streptomyces sp. NPDC005409 TaxID=3155342 RepID=UPI003452277D